MVSNNKKLRRMVITMFRIGEFSKLMQVSIRMLRYYDETGLLKPAVIDPWTGYRMYSAQQIPVLNKILYLRDSGFQTAEIAAAIQQHDNWLLMEQLDAKYAEIEQTIRAEQERLQKLDLARQEIQHGKDDLHYQITLKTIPSFQVLSLRKIIPDYFAEGELWSELSSFADKKRIQISSQTFSIYHDDEYKETDVDVEICAPVKQTGTDSGIIKYRITEPVPLMACTMAYGDFTNIAGAYQAFAQWLQLHSKYQMTGPTRQIVHRGPWNETSPDNYLTEIQIPLVNQSYEPL